MQIESLLSANHSNIDIDRRTIIINADTDAIPNQGGFFAIAN